LAERVFVALMIGSLGMSEKQEDESAKLNDAIDELRRTLTIEAIAGRLTLKDGMRYARKLQECVVSIELGRPDAAQLLQRLRTNLAANIACRELVDKIWEITTLK
jgi:hypothetical protein